MRQAIAGVGLILLTAGAVQADEYKTGPGAWACETASGAESYPHVLSSAPMGREREMLAAIGCTYVPAGMDIVFVQRISPGVCYALLAPEGKKPIPVYVSRWGFVDKYTGKSVDPF